MDNQLSLFGEEHEAVVLPAGFRFADAVISGAEETDVLAVIRTLPFREFEFHGYVGKRRTVSFGWDYDFGREALTVAEPVPHFLLPLRRAAAMFAHVPEGDLAQVLVTEYDHGAGIGWHRDKGVFGVVVGISLHSPCQFRLRRQKGEEWERVTIEATPRSAYLLSGPARSEWEHSIPAVESLRYSVTFRTLR
jgi:alkylated DNA repair dioxygenase AlkB